MNTVLKIIGRIGLALVILPALAFLFDLLSLDAVKIWMMIGTAMWFGSSLFIRKERLES